MVHNTIVEENFNTGQRVYVYRGSLNTLSIEKSMLGIVENVEDIIEEDWMGGPDFVNQDIHVKLDSGKRVNINNSLIPTYKIISVAQLNKMLERYKGDSEQTSH